MERKMLHVKNEKGETAEVNRSNYREEIEKLNEETGTTYFPDLGKHFRRSFERTEETFKKISNKES